jgi:hypothetical protein
LFVLTGYKGYSCPTLTHIRAFNLFILKLFNLARRGSMITYTKGGFQLSLITIFTTLLFLGTVGVNIALAVDFDVNGGGQAKGTTSCFVDPATKATKEKFNETFSLMRVRWDDAALPGVLIQIVMDIEGVPNNSFAMNTDADEILVQIKNKKTGTFFGHDEVQANPGVFGFFEGKYVLGKDGVLKKMGGRFTVLNFNSGCTHTGKWKAKNFAP